MQAPYSLCLYQFPISIKFYGMLKVGIDVGSTTMKTVAMREDNTLVFSDYQRHYSQIIEKGKEMIQAMMDRIGGFAFDLMIVAGVAAIQIPLLASYWAVLLILAAAGQEKALLIAGVCCVAGLFATRRI